MNEIIDNIFLHLTELLPDMRIAVMIIAMMPLVETRLAIPFALRGGLSPFNSWFFSFLGSSLIVPVLLLLLLPLINLVSRLPIFSKAGNYVLNRFSQKAEKLEAKGLKVYLGLFAFSALPLPLTGVWTASALAAILKLQYKKALLVIVLGNFVSSIILTALCFFLERHIDLIILIITLIAVFAVIGIILKSFLHKKTVPSA